MFRWTGSHTQYSQAGYLKDNFETNWKNPPCISLEVERLKGSKIIFDLGKVQSVLNTVNTVHTVTTIYTVTAVNKATMIDTVYMINIQYSLYGQYGQYSQYRV